MTAPGITDEYRQILRALSDRIVAAQKPIRILDHVKWDSGIQEEFFRYGSRQLPGIDRAYYQARPLGFDAPAKRHEFHQIELDIRRILGQDNPLGAIMQRMCREYIQVVRMLEARGTKEFGELSQELYGSAGDAFHEGGPTLADLGESLARAIANIDQSELLKPPPKHIVAEDAVK
ncbi:MAG TPA: tyrosine/phenylalanine carboxypeptidase domain-containing protein, partial [Gammaproteobacteria bacterium]|nr:tyrosine/phenylalanine carboxypeptidase domain-containing protein [Gammaproteobacteria bacterium]